MSSIAPARASLVEASPSASALECAKRMSVLRPERLDELEQAGSSTCGRVQNNEDAPYSLPEVERRPLEQPGAKVDGDARLPAVALGIENLPLIGVHGSSRAERRNFLSFEVARDRVRRPEAWIGLGPLLGESAPDHCAGRLFARPLDDLGVKPAGPVGCTNSAAYRIRPDSAKIK